MAECRVCFRHCELKEGQTGFCGARVCRNGRVEALNYGRITSLALDPIEKKPLNRFHPGSLILSVGSFGCNLRCPFCQNHEISWGETMKQTAGRSEYLPPEELSDLAVYYQKQGNIGVAFTYNEPLVGYEYVRDCARLVHERGMYNVLVTNGTAEPEVLDELLPFTDAMNIDLKGFTQQYYQNVLKGSLRQVLQFIEKAAAGCHVELTTLIIPGENDSEKEMRELCSWVRSLAGVWDGGSGRKIPLHISRFFPRFHMTDRKATDVGQIYDLAGIAGEYLDYVYTGNC